MKNYQAVLAIVIICVASYFVFHLMKNTMNAPTQTNGVSLNDVQNWMDLKRKVNGFPTSDLLTGAYIIPSEQTYNNVRRKCLADSKKYTIGPKVFGIEGIKRTYSSSDAVTVVTNEIGGALLNAAAEEALLQNANQYDLKLAFVVDDVMVHPFQIYTKKTGASFEYYIMMNISKTGKTIPNIIENKINDELKVWDGSVD